jgi:hypothetical protein
MFSILMRPLEIEGWQFHRSRDGNLIKVLVNGAAVVALVERASVC